MFFVGSGPMMTSGYKHPVVSHPQMLKASVEQWCLSVSSGERDVTCSR